MPRFYFDVSIKGQVARDDEGLELDDLDAVEREAIRAASEIVREDLSKGSASEIVLHIRDEQGQQVLRIAASMTVQRMNIAHRKQSA
jgi:uncharacterized membrane protein